MKPVSGRYSGRRNSSTFSETYFPRCAEIAGLVPEVGPNTSVDLPKSAPTPDLPGSGRPFRRQKCWVRHRSAVRDFRSARKISLRKRWEIGDDKTSPLRPGDDSIFFAVERTPTIRLAWTHRFALLAVVVLARIPR
jgi:hypothetical protein